MKQRKKVGLVFEKRTFLKMSKNEKPRWRILHLFTFKTPILHEIL
jgi:hypothetical protein